MYATYKKSGDKKYYIRLYVEEIEAADWCDVHDWELIDEDGTRWELDYERK